MATIPEALEAAEAAESVGSDAPVLILSEVAPQLAASAPGRCPDRVRFTVASAAGIEALMAAPGPARAVHLKVDTGMHRMGALPTELEAVTGALRAARARLRLEGVWTHLAVADAPDDPFTAEQLARFDRALAAMRRDGLPTGVVHAANSAGLLAHPRRPARPWSGSESPSTAFHRRRNSSVPSTLQPALELVSRIIAVRTVAEGETVSYGRHWRAGQPTRVATVAIGYADGIRRDAGTAGVEVLVRGRRCRIVGAVTMDQLMVALDPAVADETATGDEVVLIGRQGTEEITATEIAQRLGTIAYEVLTSVSARVPRVVM